MHGIVTDALITMLILSFIPMAAIALCAGTVTLIQAITQVQEQSLVHLARLGVMAALLAFGGHYAFAELERVFVTVVVMTGSRPER